MPGALLMEDLQQMYSNPCETEKYESEKYKSDK